MRGTPSTTRFSLGTMSLVAWARTVVAVASISRRGHARCIVLLLRKRKGTGSGRAWTAARGADHRGPAARLDGGLHRLLRVDDPPALPVHGHPGNAAGGVDQQPFDVL